MLTAEMTTRNQLYELAGRGLELCQLLEKEIGTALLGLDALMTHSHLNPDPDKYLRLLKAIDKNTLGQSLGLLREKLKLHDDLEGVLSKALDARNELAHRFFAQNILRIIDEHGRSEMLQELNLITTTLNQGYALASKVATTIVHVVLKEQRDSS